MLVGDDHPEVAAALQNLLDEAEGIKVVAVETTAEDAAAASARLKPHVALLDLGMFGGGCG